jgi:hypothetical protein
MSEVRFVVQGSEVFEPRMARRTRMGSREDAKEAYATWAKGVGWVTCVVLPDPWVVGTEDDLAAFGRPTPLCGLEAWRLFLFWSRHERAGEAKP